MPKVSICIPAYKQVELLRKTLQSVLMQDFADYELILTDDSPDDSVELLCSEFDFNGRLIYKRNQPSLGSPSNWNAAMKMATGSYVKILHHDDYFTVPYALSKFVEQMDNNPEAALVFCATKIEFHGTGQVKIHRCSQQHQFELIHSPEQLVITNRIGAPSAVMVRNNQQILFDEQLKWLVDIDWYIRLLQEKKELVSIHEPLICTVHGSAGQVTQSVQQDRLIQIKEHVLVFDKLNPSPAMLKRFSLLFQVLFVKYSVAGMSDLTAICPVAERKTAFYQEVFLRMNNFKFFKKLRFWNQKMEVSDYLYLLKKRFK